MRFGIDNKYYPKEARYEHGVKALNYNEIATLYDLSREGIRQIELKAMTKISHPDSSRHLRDFLDDID